MHDGLTSVQVGIEGLMRVPVPAGGDSGAVVAVGTPPNSQVVLMKCGCGGSRGGAKKWRIYHQHNSLPAEGEG